MNFLRTSVLSVGTFLCPVIITLHNRQSENSTWAGMNSACSSGLLGGLRLSLLHSLHVFPIWQSRRILWEHTFPQKQGIVTVITGTFLNKNLEKARLKKEMQQFIIQMMFFFSFCCFTSCFDVLLPNLLHYQKKSSKNQNWTWQPIGMAPKQKLKMTALLAAAFHRNTSVGKTFVNLT